MRMWRKGSPYSLSVGIQIGIVTMENSIGISQNIRNRNNVLPRNSKFGHIQRNYPEEITTSCSL